MPQKSRFFGPDSHRSLKSSRWPQWVNVVTVALMVASLAGVAEGQIISTVAGTVSFGDSGDDGPATLAELNKPFGVCVDPLGNVFIADLINSRVRRVDAATGIITTFAGGGSATIGDGGPATDARIVYPAKLCFDGSGNLYIAESGHNRIRRVDAGTGIITTVAGTVSPYGGYSGDYGLATEVKLSKPSGVCVDGYGNIFIADQYNHRIRKVDTDGYLTTIAGSGPTGYGEGGFSGDATGPALNAVLNLPTGICLDGSGNILFADQFNHRIRKVDTQGNISTVAGSGLAGPDEGGFSGDSGPALSAVLDRPTGVHVDGAGNLYIGDHYNNRIRMVDGAGDITTVAGSGSIYHNGDGIPATEAGIRGASDAFVDAEGNLVVVGFLEHRIRKVTPVTGTFTVTNANDSGYGSLRQAILNANAFPGTNLITFDIGSDVQTIAPLSALPTITDPVVIDGTTQPGYVSTPIIELDGSTSDDGSTWVSGLILAGGNSTVRGLVINSFRYAGIILRTNGGNRVEGCYIGTDVSGTEAEGNVHAGIRVDLESSGNTIGGTTAEARNVISGNAGWGIGFIGAGPNNTVQGNYIGTDVTGTAPLPNLDGLELQGNDNTIGGAAPGARNLISGNTRWGIRVRVGSGNTVAANFIGTDVSGTAALANGSYGLFIHDAPNTLVGGTTAEERNIIAGNAGAGVYILGAPATGTQIQGNYIGTDATGTDTLGNGLEGVTVSNAPNNTIGGTTAEARNLISGNGRHGIYITGSASGGCKVQGNYIGTDVSGGAGLGNGKVGVYIIDAPNCEIGGTADGARNVISSNGSQGVCISGAAATGCKVQGNYVGVDATGTVDIGNTLEGVWLIGAPGAEVGGTSPEARNIVSGNDSHGVQVTGTDAAGRVVRGNYIGTDVTGVIALGNSSSGVYISGASNTLVGGTTDGERNLISGNSTSGVYIYGATAAENQVLGNYIGTNSAGTGALGNAGSGVFVRKGPRNTIGGMTAEERNLISGNGSVGVYISGTEATENEILGNHIGIDATGTEALGNNGHGVLISEASDNTVGGTTPGAGNVISANAIMANNTHNVTISGITATGNVVQGNYIGTDVSGAVALANTGNGVSLMSSQSNTIGGAEQGARNIISGNSNGVVITGAGATENVVQGNYIGTDAGGTAALGNAAHGVHLAAQASDNLIGGTDAGAGNTIAHNSGDGVFAGSGTGNGVLANTIHSNGGLGIDLGPDGMTPNDAGDVDAGANNLQNFPELTLAASSGITGSLNSTADTEFRIEFFSNSAADDPTGHGEGETFLGAIGVTTDGSGDASFTAALPVVGGAFVSATATDPAGNTSEFCACIEAIDNQPPVVDAGGPYDVDEGGSVMVSATGSDPDEDLLTYAWDLDNNGEFETPGQEVSFPAEALDGPSTRTIRVRATDSGGMTATDEATVTVANVSPQVVEVIGPVDPVQVGTEVSLAGSFTDPCAADTHTALWDWGDETTSAGTIDPSDGSVTGTHTYALAGVYTVTLTVTDDDEGSAAGTFEYVVMFDPSAGFVTGGGWIDSPAGAYAPDPSLTGKANFGFVSRYKKGASVPTGNTQFQFKAGDLKFKSTSYQWLVVAGPQAKFKGEGTINDCGAYGFMLTGRDGEVSGGGGVDRFRIKIWDSATEAVVYDNQMNDGDDADATETIEGGSIVIHAGSASKPALGGADEFALYQNGPNPFNPETAIRYSLAEAADVRLAVYSVLGQRLRVLVSEAQEAGHHSAQWDGRDAMGREVTSGIYLYRLQAGENVAMRKMVLVK